MSDFDKQLDDLYNQKRKKQAEMEEICKKFINETQKFTIEWYKKEIEQKVVSNPELTKKHGKPVLSKLKEECKNLIQNVPEITQKYVNDDKYWSHRLSDEASKKELLKFEYDRPFGSCLNKAVRSNIGLVAELLIKYGYENEKDGSYIKTHAGWKYRYGYTWSEQLDEYNRKYAELNQDLINLNNDIEQINENKIENEAKDLWKEA